MPGKKKRLEDAYRFPGFRPSRWVRGVFGDSQVRIMVLERRQKKRLAAFAVKSTVHSTTRKIRPVRDLSCVDTRVYLEVEFRRVACRSCGLVKQEKLSIFQSNNDPEMGFRFQYKMILKLGWV